jgi:hypothetical protein
MTKIYVSFEMCAGDLTAYGDERLLSQKYLVAKDCFEVGVDGASRMNQAGKVGSVLEVGRRFPVR